MGFGESLGDAVLTLSADLTKLRKDLAQANKETGSTMGKASDLANAAISGLVSKVSVYAAGAVSIAAVGKAIFESVQAFAAAEVADRRFVTALEQTNRATPQAAEEFRGLTAALQQTTKVGDDTILGFGALLLNLGVLPDKLNEATKAGLDLAAGLDIDVRSAMMLLGKAATGNIEMFSRYGIKIDEAAFKARGFDAVLEQLNERFGGQAAKNADTLSGAYAGFKNALGDLGEQAGRMAAGPLKAMLGWADSALQGVTALGKGILDLIGVRNFEVASAAMVSTSLQDLRRQYDLAAVAAADMGRAIEIKGQLGELHKEFLRLQKLLPEVAGHLVEEVGEAMDKNRKKFHDLQDELAGLVKEGRKYSESTDKMTKEMFSFQKAAAAALVPLEGTEAVIGAMADKDYPNLKKAMISYQRQAKGWEEIDADIGHNADSVRELEEEIERAAQKSIAEINALNEEIDRLGDAIRDSTDPLEEFIPEVNRGLAAYSRAMEDMKEGFADFNDELNDTEDNFAALDLAIRIQRGEAIKAAEDTGTAWNRMQAGFGSATERGLSDFLFHLGDKTKKGIDILEEFGLAAKRVVTDAIAQFAKETFIAPAISAVSGAARGLLGFATGGLVEKPTLALLGEAGPELVIPVKAAGSFIQGAIVDAARTSAASDVALSAGIAEGSQAAQAAASAAAGLTTGAALFVFVDAINAALGGQSAIRAAGDIAFGERGKQGLIEKGLGALGVGAFQKKGGEFNIPDIQALYAEALAGPRVPPFSFNEMMAQLGSDNPERARAFLAPYLGDAEGRFITGASLRLLGEEGPEHVLNVDSPASIRALTEGLRPIMEEMLGGAGGGGRIEVRVPLILDGRAIMEVSRSVDTTLRRLPRTQASPRPSFAGV